MDKYRLVNSEQQSISAMELSDIDCCKLCFEPFSGDLRPRCLPCGHSYCTTCIENLVDDDSLTCPKCKKVHFATRAKDFSINYDLEENISSYKTAQQDEAFRLQSVEISNKLKAVISAQRVSTESLIQVNKELDSDMTMYKAYLLEEKEKHSELRQQINRLANLSDTVVEQIDEELNQLAQIKTEAEDLRTPVETKLSTLEKTKGIKRSIHEIAELYEPSAELERWNKRCRLMFPNAKIVINSDKVLTEAEAAFSMVNFDQAEEPKNREVPVPTLTILQEKDKLLENNMLNMERLKTISKTQRSLLEKCLIYAAQTKGKDVRFGRISLKDDAVYLHHLEDGEPPSTNSHTIKQSELIASLDTQSVLTFLDLAWNGSTKGRVLIRVVPKTPYGRQFRNLCTGDLGPSYVNSQLHYIGEKNKDEECVGGGNYDGKGGVSILSGLEREKDDYLKPLVAGAVWTFYGLGDVTHGAQFVITTGRGNPRKTHDRVFGQVIEGLDVVREAAKVKNIKNVVIVDCGVVIPLGL